MTFWKKHGKKIIIGVGIAVLLAALYIWGGSSPALHSDDSHQEVTEEEAEKTAAPVWSADVKTSETHAPETSAPKTNGPEEKTDLPQETAAPQNPSSPEKKTKCTISISCKTVLAHPNDLSQSAKKSVPASGIILPPTEASFSEGESVLDVLLRITREHGIPMEYQYTPLYKSSYIEGIGNLYEFDCGELSGWEYRVNGVFPKMGCSNYILTDGDTVEWLYTCDFGTDIGGTNR